MQREPRGLDRQPGRAFSVNRNTRVSGAFSTTRKVDVPFAATLPVTASVTVIRPGRRITRVPRRMVCTASMFPLAATTSPGADQRQHPP